MRDHASYLRVAYRSSERRACDVLTFGRSTCRYEIEFMVSSHDLRLLSMSYDTTIAEALLVGRKLNDGEGPTGRGRFVNLSRAPYSETDALALVRALIATSSIPLHCVKGGARLGHGVSTLGDYVRLSVKGKCPPSRLPCYQAGVLPTLRGRAMGGLSACMYFLTVSLCMPTSRAIPRMDNPLRFAFCTAFHLAVCSGVGFLGRGVAVLRTLAAPLRSASSRSLSASSNVPIDSTSSSGLLMTPLV